jgi:hypothetical protein
MLKFFIIPPAKEIPNASPVNKNESRENNILRNITWIVE